PKSLPNAPRLDAIHLDGRVLLFTLATCVFAGLLFGLVPALRGAGSDVNSTLKENVRGSSAVHQRARSVLVVVEMALALVLLVGAGLMLRTLISLWRVDPGFDPRHVISTGVGLPQPSNAPALPSDASAAMIRRMHQQIASIPGVEAASLSWGATPMWGDDEVQFWFAGEPKPATDSEMRWGLDYVVEPGYFRAMGIQPLRGRQFSDRDDERAPLIAVVDEDFARTFFPQGDPLGARINTEDYGQGIEIVGVVRHVNQWGLGANPAKYPLQAQIYFPILQLPAARRAEAAKGAGLIVRTSLAPADLDNAVRRALLPLNSQAVVFGTVPMDEIVGRTLATRRFAMLLLGIFAGLALLLASIGIYGVISYAVGQRTREIGIRMALGAQRGDVLRIVLGQGAKLTAIGVAVGVIAALALSRLLQTVLWGVRPTDPLTYAAVSALLAAVALLACFVPVRRAVRVDPTVALRYE
ncbi:MAG TPA: FtsX-like permease family protein, partial [Ramlibacter sp.]|nr:FtsX-like permease family protein [Ramlibacter sp.]